MKKVAKTFGAGDQGYGHGPCGAVTVSFDPDKGCFERWTVRSTGAPLNDGENWCREIERRLNRLRYTGHQQVSGSLEGLYSLIALKVLLKGFED